MRWRLEEHAFFEPIPQRMARCGATSTWARVCRPPPCGYVDPMAGALAIEWEDFARHMNTSDVGRVIQDIEKKLEAVEGPPPIRIMDCDPSLMSDLYGMSGLKFEPAYKTNSGIAMLNRLRVAVLEGKVRVHPKMRQSEVPATDGRFQF